jgi:YgiT-type zinc finger domain-containing protein
MICLMCKTGQTKPGTVTHTFQKGATIVIIKDIPAQVCGQCGEPYLGGEVAKVIETLVDDAVRKGAEVEILRYAA